MSDRSDPVSRPDPAGPGSGSSSAEAGRPSGRIAGAWAAVLRNPSAMILANTGAQSVLRMFSNVVLAHLLVPEAFALIAITSLVLTGLQMVSDVGIAVTALREGEMSREDEHKLWTLQFLRGFVVGGLMLVAAVPIGWVYDDPQLRDVLFALALMPVMQGAQSLYPVLALGKRHLLPSTLLEIGSRVGGMAMSILIAFIYPSVWALVLGTLAGVAVSVVGSHLMAGYGPRFVVDREYMRRQWGFSRWIQMASTLYFLGGQIDKPLFPLLFGMATFGIYGIGSALAAIPAQVTQRWSASVYYPLAVQLLLKDAAARAQLLRVRTTMLLYTALMTLAVAAIAPLFFTILYEPRYHGAIQFAQILAVGIFFDTAESSLRHMPIVEGVPQFELWSVVVRMIGFVLAAALVILLGGGATAYAFAVLFGGATGHLFMLAVCARRGYLGVTQDLVMIAAVVIAVVAIYLLPHPVGMWNMIAEGTVIGVIVVGGLVGVYLARGLPSLPAEPAPETLREAAEEELGERPAII